MLIHPGKVRVFMQRLWDKGWVETMPEDDTWIFIKKKWICVFNWNTYRATFIRK